MKNTNKYTQKFLPAIVAVTMLSACSRTDFAEVAVEDQLKSEVPVVEPSEPSPEVTYGYKLSNGECASDSSTQLLSCSKCEVPQVVPVPQLSAKAQALLDIMALSCDVPNKSDQSNFRPTRAMILNKLNRASPENYPETHRTPAIELMVQGLTNPEDDSLRKKMFGGLWYQPPYSNSFEVYFGITVQEAKGTFCWNGDKMDGVISNRTGIYSVEWLNCQYESSRCDEKPEWILGFGHRAQLEKSLELGVTNPYTPPTPEVQKKCFWDKFEGSDLIAAKLQLKKWKSEGRKVSMSVKKNGVGQCGDASDTNITEGSIVEMATYRCE